MSKSRLPLALGLTAAGGIGYYLYSAGGDGKVAQKKAEADAHRISTQFKSELPGRGEEAKKDAEKYGAQAGAKVDNTVSNPVALYTFPVIDSNMSSNKQLSKTQAELRKAADEAEAYAKDARAATQKKIDEFDKKVEAEASKAKSGISSWFGGGGK
ncbi:hypothetical protein F4805DRAFT_452639 [Annulohypoxylon moriforme]|nr:hypothetical protein F4805DRAFT_452639 [Annulohypoxylon moriforme]